MAADHFLACHWSKLSFISRLGQRLQCVNPSIEPFQTSFQLFKIPSHDLSCDQSSCYRTEWQIRF